MKESQFKGTVELLYAQDSEDAYNIALTLRGVFLRSGWKLADEAVPRWMIGAS